MRKIEINIFTNNSPAILEVFSKRNCLIFKRTLNKNKFKLFLNKSIGEFGVKVKYKNQFILKHVKLTYCLVPCLNINFVFENNRLVIQTFTLHDKNYNFPISNAVLNLKNI